MSTLLIVSGPPASGKSTLARHLRESLGWPLLAKDDFKESLFDALGWSDRAWSKRVSGASYELMLRVAAELLAVQPGCIVEGNFRWAENQQRFSRLIDALEPRIVQVFCTASSDTLRARLQARVRDARAARHPGHVDGDSMTEIEAELGERPMQPLPLGSPLIFDSSVADPTALEELLAEVRRRCAVP